MISESQPYIHCRGGLSDSSGIYQEREYVEDGPTAELPARTGRYLSLLPPLA
jgi:hypothetical protein